MKTNKGFSLIELIVTLAIAAMLVSGSVSMFQYIKQADITQATKTIGTYLDYLRVNTMSIDAESWEMVICKVDGKYYVQIYKTVSGGERKLFKEKELGTRIDIYVTGVSDKDKVSVSSAEETWLRFKFNRSTGALASGNTKIFVKHGDTERTIKIVTLTGRYYIE